MLAHLCTKCCRFIPEYEFAEHVQQCRRHRFSGWVKEEVFISTRMHLDRKQVTQLIDRLQEWLNTGTFEGE